MISSFSRTSRTALYRILRHSAAADAAAAAAATRSTSAMNATAVRTFVTRTVPLRDDDLPYHIVMGMPALSPTMESGALAEWYFQEGDSFVAGDSLAKIETDKATMDFEAQDDGYVAKLLEEAGTGKDITVGVPIMITVEEEEDVAAFKNYTPPPVADAVDVNAADSTEEAPKKAEAPAPAAAATTSPPPPPPPPPTSSKEAKPVDVSAKDSPAAAAHTPPTPTPAAAAAPPTSGWGSLAFVNSPLAKSLGNQQAAYVEKYGRTGQVPL